MTTIQFKSARTGKERAALAHSAMMRLALRADDSRFDRFLGRLKKTAEDSANSSQTASPPATSSGVRLPEESSAASTACPAQRRTSRDLPSLDTKASSLPSSLTCESQSSNNATSAPERRRASMPETGPKVVSFSPLVDEREIPSRARQTWGDQRLRAGF